MSFQRPRALYIAFLIIKKDSLMEVNRLRSLNDYNMKQTKSQNYHFLSDTGVTTMWGSGMAVTCFAEASIELARCPMVVGALSEADLWFSSHLYNSKRPRKLLVRDLSPKTRVLASLLQDMSLQY
jgi:hypothetical protein